MVVGFEVFVGMMIGVVKKVVYFGFVGFFYLLIYLNYLLGFRFIFMCIVI